MRNIIASGAAAGSLAFAWACFVVLATHGGLLRMLEGGVFLGVPAALGAAAIAGCSRFLARRLAWPLPVACGFSGLVVGTLFSIGSAVGLSSDLSVTPTVWIEQVLVFAGLGVATGALVFLVFQTTRRRRHAC